jgi:hypothetical protein
MASRRKRTLSASVRVAEALASAKPKDALRTLFETEVDELRKMEDEGVIAKGTSADPHPIRTIIRLEFTPGVPPVLQFACAKERLQYHELTAGEKARLNALGDGSPVKIELSIQPWAAAKPVLPALSAPASKTKDDIEVVFEP